MKTILDISLIILTGLISISFLIGIVKSFGKTEGYKLKELEIQKLELESRMLGQRSNILRLEQEVEYQRAQKSSIMLQILQDSIFSSGKTAEETLEDMKHNFKIMYNREEI